MTVYDTYKYCDRVAFVTEMGGKSSKTEALSKTDLDWLVRHTKYNEETIQEWHKGFRRDDQFMLIMIKLSPL